MLRLSDHPFRSLTSLYQEHGVRKGEQTRQEIIRKAAPIFNQYVGSSFSSCSLISKGNLFLHMGIEPVRKRIPERCGETHGCSVDHVGFDLWCSNQFDAERHCLPLAQNLPHSGPVELRVDDLKTPLGIDDPTPRFSWQLQDPARGAKQTAYEVQVASRRHLTAARRMSGIAGGWRWAQALNVRYAGPALEAANAIFGA